MKRTRKEKNAMGSRKRHYVTEWQKEIECPMHFKLEDFINGYQLFFVKVNRAGFIYSV
jgi:hypothetical protein